MTKVYIPNQSKIQNYSSTLQRLIQIKQNNFIFRQKMNKIIDQILQHYGEFNQVKKMLKTQVVRNHPFHIDQKFEIIDKIGKGSYSIVVAAICKDPSCLKNHSKSEQKQQDCKHVIAVKKLQNIFVHLSYTKKALRQLRGYRLLKHPNILELHTIQLPPSKEDFRQIYCIFELMDTNLQRVLQRSEQDLSEEHWKFFLYQILRALKYMHSAGVIHGNLSTKACLVNDICDLKLCEFSQIVLLSNPNRFQILTQTFEKIYYPAPQLLLKDKNFGTAIDIWSVGCIFGQMVNRKPFFQKSNFLLELYCDYVGNPRQKCNQHLNEEGKYMIKRLQRYKRQPKNFNNLFPLMSDKGIDLMRKMLTFQSQYRITAKQALLHPYFTQLHNQQCEPTREQNQDLEFQFQFEKFQNLSTEQYKKLLFQQILLYHSPPLKSQYSKKVKRKQSLMTHIIQKEQQKLQKPDGLNSYIDELISKGVQRQQKYFRHTYPHSSYQLSYKKSEH